MTARMDGSFIEYVDFIDIVQETLETAPRALFEKLVRFLLNRFHEQEVALQRLALEIDEMHTLPVDDLDEFYDTTLQAVDDIKLFKKRLEPLKTKDRLFDELYMQADKLQSALVHYMDRMGQLEVRLLQEKRHSA
ncbi:hypothetical protein [Hydrogenimonas sp.]